MKNVTNKSLKLKAALSKLLDAAFGHLLNSRHQVIAYAITEVININAIK